MIIKYCPNCSGKPYTKDLSQSVCSNCGSALMIESVDDSSLYNRPELPAISAGSSNDTCPGVDPFTNPGGGNDYNFGGFGNDNSNVSVIPNVAAPPQIQKVKNKNHDKEVLGTIYGYSCSEDEAGKYRRIFITKIIDAVGYGQRTEDVLHRFYVRPEQQGAADIPVIVHGTISAGSGLANNSLVRVSGRYKKGALYAKHINVRNGNFESPVKFQVNLAKIFVTILSFLIFFAGAFLMIFERDAVSQAIVNVKTFLTIFAIVFLILFLISLIIVARSKLLFTMGIMMRRGYSIFTIVDLILSLLITIGLYKVIAGSGIAFTIGTAFGMFGPAIIMIIGIILMISVLFR